MRYSCSVVDLQYLENNRRDVSPLNRPIFPFLPQADTGAVRILLRMLAGMKDFKRVNAHYPRRTVHPELLNDRLKHGCLYCLTTYAEIIDYSEWHAFCECPVFSAARERFTQAHVLQSIV